jgi:nitroreductase
VPSAHAYYPLEIYSIDSSGVYTYQPNLLISLSKYPADFLGLPVLTYLKKIQTGDYRTTIAEATSHPTLATAPLSIIMVLNINKTQNTGSTYVKFWYFEAGAAAHNIMLEATALGLKTNTVFPTDSAAVLSLLKLTDGYAPLLIVPISA